MQPIKLSESDIHVLASEFAAAASKFSTLDSSSIDYKKTLNTKAVGDARLSISFTQSAYDKMLKLIRHYDKEVAWHGTVDRTDKTHFTITDILVYPQTVSAATVDTDQKAYQEWLMGQPDEVFNNIRFQGHSHVNMDTHPSGTDLSNQARFLPQLGEDDYYIFMIWNKRSQWTARVYDMSTNTMYDEGDIDIANVSYLDDFIAESELLVKKYVPVVATTTNSKKRPSYTYPPYAPAGNYAKGGYVGAYGSGSLVAADDPGYDTGLYGGSNVPGVDDDADIGPSGSYNSSSSPYLDSAYNAK